LVTVTHQIHQDLYTFSYVELGAGLHLSVQNVSVDLGALKRKVSKIQTTICDNFKTVRDRMSVNINHYYLFRSSE